MNWNDLLSRERLGEKKESKLDDYPMISDFQKDYEDIISSVAFRRLQDKTQVFPLDKSDFVRTRLTHSIEVATIARMLGVMMVNYNVPPKNERLKVNYARMQEDIPEGLRKDIPEVLACAGLLHDIGNPPFGHFGEAAIGEWFEQAFKDEEFTYQGKMVGDILTEQMKQDLLNFEGNAQALRILSKIENRGQSNEMNLTYSVISSLIKYPSSSLEFRGKDDEDICKHKLGFFRSEQEVFGKIAERLGTRLENGKVRRHPLTYLVEAADDIAYSTGDVEDACKKNIISMDEFIAYFAEKSQQMTQASHTGVEEKKSTDKMLMNLKNRQSRVDHNNEEEMMNAFQNWMEYDVRRWVMHGAVYSFVNNYPDIISGAFQKELIEETMYKDTLKIFKDAAGDYVHPNMEIQKLELAAKKILHSLLSDFTDAVLYLGVDKDQLPEDKKKYVQTWKRLRNLIPSNLMQDYDKAVEKMHREQFSNDGEIEAYKLYLRLLIVTDFISGMTDSYAKNLYLDLNGLK